MPACSIITCRNRSGSVNSSNSGVTYHMFPKEPKIKEKWIDVTGRSPEWIPTKTSTICSIHFEQKCFHLLKKNKKLFPWAVPTMKIAKMYSIDGQSLPAISRDNVQSTLTEDGESSNSEINDCDVNPLTESHREIKLRQKVERCQNIIKRQRTQIKTLQKKTSRYKKKIAELEDVLTELKGVLSDL